MFGHRPAIPAVSLTTDRLIVRLVHPRDAEMLADYYVQNRLFLQPWEPVRDESQYQPSGWSARLSIISELHKQGSAFSFALFAPDAQQILGVINYSNILRGAFHACYLGYSLAEKSQGQGFMYEALQVSLAYMFRQQHMHRIMANYMPHNLRSGNLLAKLGFVREGYAKEYLLISGQWRDHVLTSLTHPQWTPSS